jgi:uncharacterized membrane protein
VKEVGALFSEELQKFLAKNLGKLIGVSVGLLLGWMIIEYGLLKTVFVMVLVIAGYFLGKKADEGEDLSSLANRIFRRIS